MDRCIGSCKIENKPYFKICLPDSIKNITVKPLDLISREFVLKNIGFHKSCKCGCSLDERVCNNLQKSQKIINKPNFISQKIIDKNLVAVHCGKKILSLNKPVYVGFCILELSKFLMYQFHHVYVLETFNNVKLFFTDTDSLVYEIKDENVYEQSFKDKELFDFSGYSKDSIYFDDCNKKKLGKMKDELNGNKIDEFVGLKSKMYSLISNNWEVNKAKGVNLKLKHKEYVDVLLNKNVVRYKMKRILREKHNIGSYLLNKISLSCYDDERFILDDGINSLAYGHENIDKI